MYFGSVRFFKHLIIIVVAVAVAVPVMVMLSLFFKVGMLEREVGILRGELEVMSRQSPRGTLFARLGSGEAGELSADELAELLELNGISFEEMLAAYGEDGVRGQEAAPVSEEAPAEPENGDLGYQSMYPDLYVSRAASNTYKENTMYLTFDDGPSDLTPEVLDILGEHDIKATFFVTGWMGESSGDYLRAIAEQGHAIGAHSYSHKYSEIYSSVEAFLDDFYKIYSLIYEATGEPPNMFRFAGGSINSYNYGIYQEIISEMTRRGFVYYDWNVSGMDAADSITSGQITYNVLRSAGGKSRGIVLLHDSTGKRETVEALPGIISALSEWGYKFDKLSGDVKPITFGYTN